MWRGASAILLSVPQKFVLAKLKEFGALRGNQLAAMLEMAYPGRKLYFSGLMRKLVLLRKIAEPENGLYAFRKKYDPRIPEAVDAMLQFPRSSIVFYRRGNAPPILLSFVREKGNSLMRYEVCKLEPGKEAAVCATLEGLSVNERTVLFLADSISQQALVQIPCAFCFAIFENGVYRFYKTERKIADE